MRKLLLIHIKFKMYVGGGRSLMGDGLLWKKDSKSEVWFPFILTVVNILI